MVDDRLNSCGRFRKGQCQCQDDMARLYLIPQILEPGTLATYEKSCLNCGDYVPWPAEGPIGRRVYVGEPPAHLFFGDVTLPGSLFPETAYF